MTGNPNPDATAADQTFPPNPWRRLLAEIFADAEDHGLGVWTITFAAADGKTELACKFIEARAALLAETRLGETT